MSRNTEEFNEYREYASAPDYAHPSYYDGGAGFSAPSSPPAQMPEPSVGYPDYASPAMYSYDPSQLQAYTGPASLEKVMQEAESGKNDAAQRSKRRKGLAGLGGIGASIIALLVKFKTLLVLLLDFKWVAVFAKFGFAGVTALVSIAAYSLLFGWPFAIGLVALLFLHEMGHAIVMKMKGIPVGGMIFIPLLGAAVFMRQMPKNARDEAEVGIAGPIAGAIASSVCLFFAQVYPDTIWAPLAYFGFFLNLFNLIPIVPFDGGRVLAAIDRRLWIVGFLALVGFQVWSFIQYHSISIWLLFFIFMAATQLVARRSAPNTPELQAYYTVSVGERIILTLAYFGLAAVLVLGMTIAHGMMLHAIP